MTLQCSAVRTGADPSRGMWEQVRMLQEVVFYLAQLVKVIGFQGGSEGEAEQPTFKAGGVASKRMTPKHEWERVQGRVLWVSEQKGGSFQVLELW